ncbi:MAG: polysaccharide deacetylase family protein, partial [Rhizomicrobium sp.]
MINKKPVFFDATGRRAARLSTLAWMAGLIAAVLAVGFVASLLMAKPVPTMDLPGRAYAANQPGLAKKAIAPGLLRQAVRLATEARNRRLEIRRERRLARLTPSRVLPAILAPQKDRSLAVGFYVNWGEEREASFDSLKRALPRLDWVIPTWLTLEGPRLSFKPAMDRRALDYMRAAKPGIAIIPLIQNASGGRWDGPGLSRLLADPARSESLAQEIVAFLVANKLQGVAIDFEDVPGTAHKTLGDFLRRLSQLFAPHNFILVQAAPFDDEDWPYRAYSRIVDYTLLMAYDETDESGPPGAIAGQGWYEKTLDRRMRQLPADSTIVAIGAYGYDWINGGSGDGLGFSDAIMAARDSGARIMFDATDNPHFSYLEADGTKHEVWFLDGVTAYNEIHAADPYRPAGYALWRLGSEDPSVLPLLGRRYGASVPNGLHTIPITDDVDFDGNGELLHVEANPTEGLRSLAVQRKSGMILEESYLDLPTNYVIRRVGLEAKKIALTFDDGPDSVWTPKILDILRRKHVTATFFVIGANMEAHPSLVQRILAEGHEVGNHTYTHPNLADTPLAAVRLELNATQLLFEALTGRSLRLLRPPYMG